MLDLFKRNPDADTRSWSERLKQGLGRTRELLTRPITLPLGRKTLSDESIEELESALIAADVGVPAATHLLDDMKQRWKRLGADGDPREALRASLSLSPETARHRGVGR
jgi:fused signal recognition particle receptor